MLEMTAVIAWLSRVGNTEKGTSLVRRRQQTLIAVQVDRMSAPHKEKICPLVGVGASAGGLEALTALLDSIKAPPALALVICQHTAPDHDSLLPSLLGRHTALPVTLIEDGEAPVADHVYVAPPGRALAICGGAFRLSDPPPHTTPIDHFFRSLGLELGARSAGVVLSGAGSDGSIGLRAIREHGGISVAQDPSSASYQSMPLSAITQRVVDCVLRPAEMIEYLVAHFQAPPLERTPDELEARIPKMLELVKLHTGQDFQLYKKSTIKRRVQHRMGLCRIRSSEAYLAFLKRNPDEVGRLASDLLVGVTRFFRDTEAFQALEQHVFPALASLPRTLDDPIRIWVPGCSTGEEAYSLAMTFSSYLEREGRQDCRFAIFATDLDPEAVETGRTGCYPEGVTLDIPPPFLAKYFDRRGDFYEIIDTVRECVTFAVHSVAEDPPFSRMDLVSCRNLLIYLQPELQETVLDLLHYSLKADGFLLLGSAEGIGNLVDHFESVDRQWKLFRKLPRPYRSGLFPSVYRTGSRSGGREHTAQPGLRAAVERELLEEFCPTAVVAENRGQILYIHGEPELFFTTPKGTADFSLLRMARDELKAPLMSLLTSVSKDSIARTTLARMGRGQTVQVELGARPFQPEDWHPPRFLITFRMLPGQQAEAERAVMVDGTRVEELERELAATQAYLRTTIEELETSNEELVTTNEELQSANEELHSTNEELETAREELQSVNKELATVNRELNEEAEAGRLLALAAENLLNSSELALILVNNRTEIQRYTPAASRLANLLPSDQGRPLGDLAFRLELEQETLAADVRDVIQSLSQIDREIRCLDGQWYAMRIKPYRSVTNVIDGAVLTFRNITRQKTEVELQRPSIDAAAHAPQSLMALDLEGNLIYCNSRCPYPLGEKPPFWSQYLSGRGRSLAWQSVTRCLDDKGGLFRREILVSGVTSENGKTLRLVASETVTEDSDSLFDVLGGYLLCLDSTGRVIRMNKELREVLGLPEESVLGKDWLEEFVMVPDREKSRNVFLCSDGRGERCEARIAASTGPLMVCWRALALAEVSPGKSCCICIGENIGQLYRARRAAQRSGALMRVFRLLSSSVRGRPAEETVLQSVCKSLVSEAGYLRAWVGFVDLSSSQPMEPVVAEGHARRTSSAELLVTRLLGKERSIVQPVVHQDKERAIVTILLPMELGSSLGVLELDAEWEAFQEDEVEALSEFSLALGEFLRAIRENERSH